MVSDKGLRVTRQGCRLDFALNRPERRNALTPALIERFLEGLETAVPDDGLRVITITSSNEGMFCSGFDLGHLSTPGQSISGRERDLVEHLANAVEEHPLPVVAAVGGPAVGAGCDLALACDVRVFSRSGSLSMPPARIGILYGVEGMRRLLNKVGVSVAQEMLATGSQIMADRCERLGLTGTVVSDDDLAEALSTTVDLIASNAPLSVQAQKQTIRVLTTTEITEETMISLQLLQDHVWSSEDAAEGALAARERRTPHFLGK